MIKRLFFLLLLLVSGAASADAPVPQYSYSIYPSGTGWAASVSAAADGQMTYYNANPSTANGGQWGFTVASVATSTYTYRKTCLKATGTTGGSCTVGTSSTSTNTPSVRQWCADGSAPDTSKPLAQQCPYTCAKDLIVRGEQQLGTDFSSAVTAAFPTCMSQCTVVVTEQEGCYKEIATGKFSCVYKMNQTGGTCSSDDAIPPSPHPPDQYTPGISPPTKAPGALDCPKGTVQAGISADGIPLCVGSGTTPQTSTSDTSTTKPPVTVTNADGSTTKTEQTDTRNPDGSTTTKTTTTTTKPDGTVTVAVGTTTGNTPAGTPGKPGANGKDGQSLCQSNPELAICRNSTVSGDCDAGGAVAIACTGDAVQCATLRAAKALQCKQQKDDADFKASAAYAKGSAVLAGNDPDGSTLPTVGNAASVAVPTSLDTAGFAGAGSPFSDVSFSVQGKTFTLPFNKWTGYLEALRYVMMVVASLVSFRMLSGAILRD